MRRLVTRSPLVRLRRRRPTTCTRPEGGCLVATIEQARRLVDVLASELAARSGAVLRHDNYYRGRHPLKFASEEFQKYCAERYADFSDNWTQPVADSPVERLTVTGVKA